MTGKALAVSFLPLCILTSHAATGITAGSLGIMPDPTTPNTRVIQEAINLTASRADTLVFGKGTYVIGSLSLPDNAHIHLEEGALLLGSTDPYDYNGYADTIKNSVAGLIGAHGSKNISITGPGAIDGRGLEVALAIDSLHHTGTRRDPKYSLRRMRPSLRPKLIDFNGVDNLLIEDVRLAGSAAWGLSLDKCTNVKICGIDFTNRAYWNNDGIDIADCKNVIVKDCNINSADDGIVLKSFDPTDRNENIRIENCTIRSSASAVKFGTESFGGFKNVRISDITVRDTYRSAIALETVDGAVLEDVVVDGIDALNTGNAIFIRLGHRRGEHPGALRNVTIRNLTCEIPQGRPDMDYDLRGPDINVIHNPFPSSITGIPGAKVENISLENISITYPGRATKGMGYIGSYRYGDVPEAIADYPEFHMFGELPSWAFYLRHIDGIKFDNVKVNLRENDYRPAVVSEDVNNMTGFPTTE